RSLAQDRPSDGGEQHAGCDPSGGVSSLLPESAIARGTSAVESSGGGVFLCDSAGRELLGEHRRCSRYETERRRGTRQPVLTIEVALSSGLGRQGSRKNESGSARSAGEEERPHSRSVPHRDAIQSAMIRLLFIFAAVLSAQRIELDKIEQKTVLLFSPHPDDDMFCCAGTLALMAKHRNNIQIYLYTNGDKGSADPEMTSEHLAAIRMKEEIAASKILGIPEKNIHWLEYHDGMLEYANPRDLVEEVTRIIRVVRPDVVMAPDPGSEQVR